MQARHQKHRGTVLVIALVLLMPPYRDRHWLSRFTSR
jgi:hypothetical protein